MNDRVSMLGREGGSVRNGSPAHRLKAWTVTGSAGWLSGLASPYTPPEQRLRDPFASHTWVSAAAQATAQALSQAPYTIWQETEEEMEARARRAKSRGRPTHARAGSGRRAIARHLATSIQRRLVHRGLEADPDHPLTALMLRPNPNQSGMQLIQTTVIWLQVRGEVFWIRLAEDGTRLGPTDVPGQLWAEDPDRLMPILENTTHGALVGWWYAPPPHSPLRALGTRVPLQLHEVAQFKFPHPHNPLRGMSRITAAALGIELDLMIRSQSRALVNNNGEPSGVITYDGVMPKEEAEAVLEAWEQRHAGPMRAGRTALLGGGFSYTKIGLSPQDMQYLETLRWNRNEVLAVMGVPPAILGLTEDTNYATALGQTKLFWANTVLPILRLIEDVVDTSLLWGEPDSVVGAFDLSNVEALRVGLIERFESAAKLAGSELHAPPRAAYEVYGLEVEPYVGDDTALVSAVLAPVADVVAGTLALPSLPGPSEDGDDDEEPGADEPGTPAGQEEPALKVESREQIVHRIHRVLRARSDDFLKAEAPLEQEYRGRFRQWVRGEKVMQLERFDRLIRGRKAEPFDPAAVLLPLKEVKDRLKARVRPIYVKALNATFEFTLRDLGGVAVFEIDDPSIVAVMSRREARLLRTVPETLRKNLVTELTEAIRLGETVQQARMRIAQVYEITASAPKTLTVARTEMAGFMNSTRDAMFDAQGITEEMWSTAGDEHVREAHVQFGASGAHPRGFDYLTLIGESGGRLRFPGDDECTLPGMTVNCRCVSIPAK